MAESWCPGERESERSQQRRANRERQSAEEGSGHTGNGDQREKDDDRRHRRADQRDADLAQRAANRLATALSRIAVQHDVLHHHNRVVDDQSHRGGKTSQGHQVEALVHQTQGYERDADGGGNDQCSDQRAAPVAQEDNQNDRGEQQADENGVAHTGDGIANQRGLIVECLHLDARRKCPPNLVELAASRIRHGDGVAVRLAEDIQEHSGFAVGRNHGVHGHDRRAHGSDIADSDGNTAGRGPDDNVPDLRRIARLPGYQCQRQLMVVLDQAGRVDHVGLGDRVENARHRHLRLEQLGGIGLDQKLGDRAALQHHHGDSIHAVQARLDRVVGKLPELRLRHRVRGQAVADDWKCGEGETIRRELRRGR